MKPKLKANWNSGMNYGFFMIKTMMSVIGVWPFQRNDLFSTIRWLAIVLTEVIIMDNYTITAWNYPLSTTCLFAGVSYRTYKALIVIQAIQYIIIALAECTSDGFFFCITMHLCGQLELLRNRFAEIRKETNNEVHQENSLRPLIIRHQQLITLARNIENSFNMNILIRFILISVVIAMSGLRIIISFRQHKYNEVMKLLFFIQFYVLQCFMFTHAGDTLHSQSASISTSIYNTSWYELSPTIVKDMMLVMVRLKTPLQLSAGKFFFLTRSTMTDILKTTITYISFLRVTIED
ncbi:PREDICTED: odorant receptor 85b-like [Dinoponera quadriceps]|uniref:Odorant receptor 85b-like n=1 Tax=Dinoponera quadriceps TaxID=609295 RepID=A0A6P3YBY6_DINQU|nr:PREDICTED: odorant receptor 85b-like [Dinoponera quadriceps]